MDEGRWREGLRSGAVVAGSVWESRMKVDEVKGGIKVFNDDQELYEETTTTSSNAGAGTRTRSKRGGGAGGGGGAVTAAAKRKIRKSESSEDLEKNPVSPIQTSKGKTESLKNCDEQYKELSVSVDGVKKNPTQVMRRLRSEGSPIGIRKPRYELLKSASDLGKDCGEAGDLGTERDSKSIQLRKVKSESNKGLDNGAQLRKTKSESVTETVDESDKEIEKNPVEIEKSGSDENCKEFGVCQEMMISSNVDDLALKSAPEPLVPKEEDDGDQLEEEEEEVVVDEEIEAETEQKSVDIKEINVNPLEEKSSKVNINDKKKVTEVNEEKKFMKVNEEKKVMEVNEEKKVMKVNEEKKVMKVNEEKKVMKVNEVKKVLQLERKEVKKIHQFNQKPEPISLKLNKPAPVIKRASVHSNISKYPNSFAASNEYHRSSFPETHTRLQSLVDLIMWKDISRSVFVFGIGTFVILSSSYTKDINISFISVISYMGLLYLAAIFLFKSIICRGALETDKVNYVVGEEEATWLLKLVLPYLNELLLKIRALFSGDPATTIKLAVLLFVLARCGSSITIWTMSKVGFFGVFTVPKICSLYSAQITVYANFWVRRFRDAWDSCSHKKALSIGIFMVVWNLSSVEARIWAAFILVVAFRYYQQKLVREEEWVEEVEDEA